MKARQIDLPNRHRDLSGPALHVEAYELGDCLVYVSREELSDATATTRDFRWRLRISHPKRTPTLEEICEARKLLPEDIHFAMPFPHRAYWVEHTCIELIEVHDANFTEQVEYEAIERRRKGKLGIWDEPVDSEEPVA